MKRASPAVFPNGGDDDDVTDRKRSELFGILGYVNWNLSTLQNNANQLSICVSSISVCGGEDWVSDWLHDKISNIRPGPGGPFCEWD